MSAREECGRPLARDHATDHEAKPDGSCECSECVSLCWGDPWDCARASKSHEAPRAMTLDEALERIALQARTITEQAAEIDRLRAEIAAAVEAARS